MRTEFSVLHKLMVIPEYVFIIRGKLLGVELEAADVETIAGSTGGIVGNRDLVQMGRQDRIQRMEGDAGLRQKVDRPNNTAGRMKSASANAARTASSPSPRFRMYRDCEAASAPIPET